MVIEVRLYDFFERLYLVNARIFITVDVEEGITLRELTEQMEINNEKLKIIKVNGVAGNANCVLFDGDKVLLYY